MAWTVLSSSWADEMILGPVSGASLQPQAEPQMSPKIDLGHWPWQQKISPVRSAKADAEGPGLYLAIFWQSQTATVYRHPGVRGQPYAALGFVRCCPW